MAAMVTHPRGPALAAHCHAAGFAELRGLGFHAGGNLRHVRNNIGTKPHGVGGACLADGVTTLGSRAVDTTKQDGREQDKRAGQVNDPHDVFPGVSDFNWRLCWWLFLPTTKDAGEITAGGCI